MRPGIDLNNLWYSEETLVYYSRSNTIFKVVVFLLFILVGFYLLFVNLFIVSILLFIASGFLFQKNFHFLLEWDRIQLRVNSEDIQVKNKSLISWASIKNERITYVKVNRGRLSFFEFYDIELHKSYKFNADDFNFSPFELMKSVKIHRERFVRNNEIELN